MQDSQIIRTEYSDIMQKIIYRLCDECHCGESVAGCQRWSETGAKKNTLRYA